ncbi:unnamed protein product [Sympodiomycopsis kandeliae]
MALDSALFTLYFLPRRDSPSLRDVYSRLPSPSSSSARGNGQDVTPPNYILSRAIRCPTYQTTVLEGLTEVELGTVTGTSSNSKSKTISLYNPDISVEVIRKGHELLPMWKHEWQFTWQDEIIVISQQSTLSSKTASFDVEIIRKPDPPIKIAIFRPDNTSNIQDMSWLQLLDYNIDRIENITDKRGLEHVIVLLIASCLDALYDDRFKNPAENVFLNPVAAFHDQHVNSNKHSTEDENAAKSKKMEPNEVLVLPQYDPEQIVQHCLHLLRVGPSSQTSASSLLRGTLQGQGCDLIVIKANGQEMAQRALTIAERTKVGFYRLPPASKGVLWDGSVPEELHQYVRSLDVQSEAVKTTAPVHDPKPEEEPSTSSVRPRIKLGGRTTSSPSPASPTSQRPPKRTPPPPSTVLAIYLSKSRLEEFEAEQAAKMRARMEEQSKRLAERLEHEEHHSRTGSNLDLPRVSRPTRPTLSSNTSAHRPSPSPSSRPPRPSASPAPSPSAGNQQPDEPSGSGSRFNRFLNRITS